MGWVPDGQPGSNELSCLAGQNKPFLPACSMSIFPGALCLIRKIVAVENETIKDTEMGQYSVWLSVSFIGSREIYFERQVGGHRNLDFIWYTMGFLSVRILSRARQYVVTLSDLLCLIAYKVKIIFPILHFKRPKLKKGWEYVWGLPVECGASLPPEGIITNLCS